MRTGYAAMPEVPIAQGHQVEIIDRLIVSAAASAEGYRSAASETSDPALRLRLTDRAEESEDLLLELETRIRELGGEPAAVEIRPPAAPRPGRRYSLTLAELARREDDTVQRFERALASTGLDAATRAALSSGVRVLRDRPAAEAMAG